MDFFDWELSVTIGALRSVRKEYERSENPSKAYLTFLRRLEDKFSRALGEVLKAEFRDLKLGNTKPLIEDKEASE